VRQELSIRLLGPGDESVLEEVDADVFDAEVVPALAREFLRDPRHHLAVAVEGRRVVGMASGVHYVHPDKPAQLFVNEVGVAAAHRRRGVGRRLLRALLARARELGCSEAWVATEPDNAAARALYAAAGGVEEPEPSVLYSFPLSPARPSGSGEDS
jgi:aminoglycoside 6'-N-acetyltransferase I